jgi:hypothetical protein
MKFSTVILGAFVALAAAAPAPQPDAAPADINDAAKLEARQGCGRCYNGTRNCCGVGGCMLVRC